MQGLTTLLEIDKDWIPQSDSMSLYIRPFMIADSEFIRATPANEFKFMIITSPTSTYYAGKTNLKIEQNTPVLLSEVQVSLKQQETMQLPLPLLKKCKMKVLRKSYGRMP